MYMYQQTDRKLHFNSHQFALHVIIMILFCMVLAEGKKKKGKTEAKRDRETGSLSLAI